MARWRLATALLTLCALLAGIRLGLAETPLLVPQPGRSAFLDRAQDLERKQLWQQAADIYQRALRYYPDDNELRQRWHLAEQVYSLNRRYHDTSFQNDLLSMSESSALELYREVLSKIRTHYVKQADMKELVLSGYRTLDLALDRPEFQATNYPHSSANELADLESRVEMYYRQVGDVTTFSEAILEARRAAKLCQSRGGRHSSAAILEFISGACESLDPYSSHLSPQRLDELYAMIDGNFVGLGIEVRGAEGGLQILEVLPDSPASDAGLHDGDRIVAIDGTRLAGMNSEDAANRLQGKEGTDVELTVADSFGIERVLPITRREVIVKSIRDIRMLPETHNVGYLRIESFQKGTDQELKESVAALERQGMRRLVIDLRGNPGGLLDVSLDAANLFIGDGVLVSTKGRAWGQNWAHRARPISTFSCPLAVLVDGESASASEIFAGAIQDHQRGTIVGTRTYGKGSVQSIFPLTTARTGLRLTTALFFSPNGTRLQGVGVQPDVIVARGEGQLGQEPPVARTPQPSNDPQLRSAIENLQVGDGIVALPPQ